MAASRPTREHVLFVTGRLAAPSLLPVVESIAAKADFDFSIETLGITVAALMTTEWVGRQLHVPEHVSRVVLPGYCGGDLAALTTQTGKPFERGPKDLRNLPRHFAQGSLPPRLDRFDIEIIAEINYAPRLSIEDLLRHANRLRADGADVIDLGCEPGETWSTVGDAVRALRDSGHRISIDSLNVDEIAAATRAGAELVLSVNATNRHAAGDWGAEVVAIPDDPASLDSLEPTLELLDRGNVRFRVDAILEPIGFGLARSLGRYIEARRRWPAAAMMMGIGNLTELTDVDSAGINTLLLGFCQELAIHSVLTTEVAPWCRTVVRECDLARRVMLYAIENRTLPKHVEPRLIMLRDPHVNEPSPAELDTLAREIKDHNYRLFAAGGQLHLLSAGLHIAAEDAFDLLAKLNASGQRRLDADHAFYLGYELAKATTALTLGKQYEQDTALDWGMLTRAEVSRAGHGKSGRPPRRTTGPAAAPEASEGQLDG